MRTITAFPAQHMRINQTVKALLLPHALSKDEETSCLPPELAGSNDYRNADFFVELKSGKTYSFLAATPDFVKDYMQAEAEKSFISPGLVLLQEINLECILDAIEHWLGFAEGDYIPLEHFGVLQIDLDE